MARTHPHIDSPTAEQLAALVAERPAPLAEAYLRLHELVLEALPDVRFSVDTVDHAIGYGAHQYDHNGWGMAALTPFGKWVSLTLLQGSRLDDPAGLLSGSTTMRHVKVSTPDEIAAARAAIIDLVRDAAGQR
ncbi:DUF1801 domain-containing protein [Propionibacteriaceae bacterium Y1923]